MIDVDIKYYLANRREFTRTDRVHECEIPKGDCWRITVKHDLTGDSYEYWEEDCYYSLEDQLGDSPEDIGWSKL